MSELSPPVERARTVPHPSSAAPAAEALSIRNLSRRFGGAIALDRVDLTIRRGEVHGLLGQNGSGKSTLIKILAGYHDPEPGAELTISGRPIQLPLAAGEFRGLGISFVHQHLGLVPSLSVLENLLIGDNAEDRWVVPWQSEARRARALFARFGLKISPSTQVSRLSSVEQAMFAIIRAFDQLERLAKSDVRLLILDEPTPFLPASDVQELFRLVREIVAAGASVIFVSHDIDEVMEITDRLTVLRDGRLAGTLETKSATKAEVIRLIIGRDVDLGAMRLPARALGEDRVRIEHLSGPGLQPLNVTVKRGEILGLTGLIGSGYEAAVNLAYGATAAASGRLVLDGESFDLATMTPDRAIASGVVLIPGDRNRQGAVGSLSITDNANLPILGRFGAGFWVRESAKRRNAEALVERFDVRPRDPAKRMGQLSGGNAQKVVLAKWFQLAPKLVLLEEPTQGVDIGAREQVFGILREMAEDGTSVICASSDHEQLAAICDRVMVFVRGRHSATLEGPAISKPAIAALCYSHSEPMKEVEA